MFESKVTAPGISDSTPVLKPRRHIPVLDGIRGIAVLMVIVLHFWQLFATGQYTLLGRVSVWGGTGVDLFFVLSGFLITGILLDSKGSEHFLRNFYVRRVLRIFPLYYLTLIVYFFLAPLIEQGGWTPWRQHVWFWIYLQNIPMTFTPSLVSGRAHFWSLAVEEHYYFVWPLLVMTLRPKKLLTIIAATISLTPVLRGVLMHYGAGPFSFTLCRFDGLAIGSAVALLARSPVGLKHIVKHAWLAFVVLGPVLALSQLVISGRGFALVEAVKSTLIALVYGALMILALEGAFGRVASEVLSGRILGSVGKYSYGMYVVHPFVFGWLSREGLPYKPYVLGLGVAATYALAWLLWNLFEQRFLRLKIRFQCGRAHPVSSAQMQLESAV